MAAGEILRQWPRALVLAFFAGSVILMGVCTYWVIYLDYLP